MYRSNNAYIMILFLLFIFFFKQKTAYEMRICDWSSDVCSSDLSRDSVSYTANANSSVEKGGDAGVIGWSRLGNVAVGYRNSNGQSFTAQPFASQFWHSIWGTPATDLPTSGLINYDLVGFTSPTQANAQETGRAHV